MTMLLSCGSGGSRVAIRKSSTKRSAWVRKATLCVIRMASAVDSTAMHAGISSLWAIRFSRSMLPPGRGRSFLERGEQRVGLVVAADLGHPARPHRVIIDRAGDEPQGHRRRLAADIDDVAGLIAQRQ